MKQAQTALRKAKTILRPVQSEPINYGRDGTDMFKENFRPFSAAESNRIQNAFLKAEIVGKFGCYCGNDQCPSLTSGQKSLPRHSNQNRNRKLKAEDVINAIKHGYLTKVISQSQLTVGMDLIWRRPHDSATTSTKKFYLATKCIAKDVDEDNGLGAIYVTIKRQNTGNQNAVAAIDDISFDQPAARGVVYTYPKHEIMYPLDPLGGIFPRPHSINDVKNQKFECLYCQTEFCRFCREEDSSRGMVPRKWHTEETCEEVKIRHDSNTLDRTGLMLEATSKRCPFCNSMGQHFHGHHCHHISRELFFSETILEHMPLMWSHFLFIFLFIFILFSSCRPWLSSFNIPGS